MTLLKMNAVHVDHKIFITITCIVQQASLVALKTQIKRTLCVLILLFQTCLTTIRMTHYPHKHERSGPLTRGAAGHPSPPSPLTPSRANSAVFFCLCLCRASPATLARASSCDLRCETETRPQWQNFWGSPVFSKVRKVWRLFSNTC